MSRGSQIIIENDIYLSFKRGTKVFIKQPYIS